MILFLNCDASKVSIDISVQTLLSFHIYSVFVSANHHCPDITVVKRDFTFPHWDLAVIRNAVSDHWGNRMYQNITTETAYILDLDLEDLDSNPTAASRFIEYPLAACRLNSLTKSANLAWR